MTRLLLVDPATPALHEVAEPARLRALVRQLRASRVQDSPVLVTDERHGLLVLDGVHRTKALLSLGIPRMLAVHVPREEVADPEGWTHRLRGAGVAAELLAAVRARAGLDLRPAGEREGRPVVARLVTAEGSWDGCATNGDGAARVAAFRALAETYQAGPYERVATPGEPAEDELQVRWVVPPLADVEALVGEHGALPAGVTRFALPPLQRGCRVTFAELGRASTPEGATALLGSLLPHGD